MSNPATETRVAEYIAAAPLAPQIAEQLTEAKSVLAVIESKRGVNALAVVQGTPNNGRSAQENYDLWHERLAAARERVADLEAAQDAAADADSAALLRQAQQFHKAKIQAIRQHRGTLNKTIAAMQASIREAASAYASALSEIELIRKLADGETWHGGDLLVGFDSAVAAEIYRSSAEVATFNPSTGEFRDLFPGANRPSHVADPASFGDGHYKHYHSLTHRFETRMSRLVDDMKSRTPTKPEPRREEPKFDYAGEALNDAAKPIAERADRIYSGNGNAEDFADVRAAMEPFRPTHMTGPRADLEGFVIQTRRRAGDAAVNETLARFVEDGDERKVDERDIQKAIDALKAIPTPEPEPEAETAEPIPADDPIGALEQEQETK
jgi:hypothetical protein